MTELIIPRPLATAVLAHGQEHPEQRICGLIRGTAQQPRQQRLHNAATDPHTSLAWPTVTDADDVLAVYWSQPESGPLPAGDEVARIPIASRYLLVISLNIRGVLELRAFARDGAGCTEVPLRVLDD